MPEPIDPVALRYARGELPGAAAAAFEERLAIDQSACDRLVRAVAQDWPAPGGPRPSPRFRAAVRRRLRRRGLHRAAWYGVACCLAVVLAVAALTSPVWLA